MHMRKWTNVSVVGSWLWATTNDTSKMLKGVID